MEPDDDLLGTLHAAEHAMISLLPLLAICDRGDIGGLSTDLHFQTGVPTIFVYDGHPGGVGIAERGFELFELWVERTALAAARVPVQDGLPLMRAVAQVRQPERAALESAARSRLLARLAATIKPTWYSCRPRGEEGSRCESGAVPPL